MNKQYAVLTSITNHYDKWIKDPMMFDFNFDPNKLKENIDWICYTDYPQDYFSSVYDIRNIPNHIRKIFPENRHFSFKLSPFSWTDGNIILWMDSSIYVKKDILPLFKWFEQSDYEFAVGIHSWLSTCHEDNVAFSGGHSDMYNVEYEKVESFINNENLSNQVTVQTTLFLCKRTPRMIRFFDTIRYIEGYVQNLPGLMREEQQVVMWSIREIFGEDYSKICLFSNNMPYNYENSWFGWCSHGSPYPQMIFWSRQPWEIRKEIDFFGVRKELINIDDIN